jgi:hypothetical protein
MYLAKKVSLAIVQSNRKMGRNQRITYLIVGNVINVRPPFAIPIVSSEVNIIQVRHGVHRRVCTVNGEKMRACVHAVLLTSTTPVTGWLTD